MGACGAFWNWEICEEPGDTVIMIIRIHPTDEKFHCAMRIHAFPRWRAPPLGERVGVVVMISDDDMIMIMIEVPVFNRVYMLYS